ncbi:MAG: hypothetical protein NZ932_04100 [Candidatus Bathyarchaeota archaeon]|nr:hypothetical protein [Candidatus Bathyarchaeota archaeon]MDW8022348.1 hypothetical protein [Nitrososphaerota archaeon]
MEIVNYIQGNGRHSINLVLAIYSLSQKGEVKVKDVKQWIRREFRTSISDIAYKNRRDELVKLGLLELKPLGRLKSTVALTPKGVKFAELLVDFCKNLEALEQN